jgi:hypothetical protein
MSANYRSHFYWRMKKDEHLSTLILKRAVMVSEVRKSTLETIQRQFAGTNNVERHKEKGMERDRKYEQMG